MAQYIYLLSNPSMPGLIKIGRTTTSPDQRMAELHSTGVPTPFELEASFEVQDCQQCEYAAHRALAGYRVSENREFFRISINEALIKILPIIAPYKLHVAKSTFGVKEIENELDRKRREGEEIQRQAALERQRVREEIEREISSEMNRLAALGSRPTEAEKTGAEIFLRAAYLPLPVGWLTWLAALKVFGDSQEEVGVIAILILILGYFANEDGKKKDSEYEQRIAPFREIEKRISHLKSKL